jgi:hypothetical protein
MSADCNLLLGRAGWFPRTVPVCVQPAEATKKITLKLSILLCTFIARSTGHLKQVPDQKKET